jgi:SAM-dependent methyltransferase
VRLVACTACGHVYNDLAPKEIAGLGAYYNLEYAPANLQSIVKEGDLPGSTGANTQGRYTHLYELLAPHLDQDSSVLDVGCAVGGFLDFLKQKEVSGLYGVDMTEEYVARAREKKYVIELGDAECLPFDDANFDVLVIEQVMEHLIHPGRAFQEAGRVLKSGGVLCIGVPDAARYAEFYYYDFYWLLMREHIQHFDIHGLSRLALANGFELLELRQSAHPIMSEKMVMPNLSATFRYTAQPAIAEVSESAGLLSQSMKGYVATETARLNDKRKMIRKIIESQRPVYVWGIGREFLYLYEAAGLKNCNLVGCVDTNPFKQRNITINGMKAEPSGILGHSNQDAVLMITAPAHEEQIKQGAFQAGFRGEIISVLNTLPR